MRNVLKRVCTVGFVLLLVDVIQVPILFSQLYILNCCLDGRWARRNSSVYRWKHVNSKGKSRSGRNISVSKSHLDNSGKYGGWICQPSLAVVAVSTTGSYSGSLGFKSRPWCQLLWDFLWDSSVAATECQNRILSYVTTSHFHIVSSSLFTVHPFIRRSLSWPTESQHVSSFVSILLWEVTVLWRIKCGCSTERTHQRAPNDLIAESMLGGCWNEQRNAVSEFSFWTIIRCNTYWLTVGKPLIAEYSRSSYIQKENQSRWKRCKNGLMLNRKDFILFRFWSSHSGDSEDGWDVTQRNTICWGR